VRSTIAALLAACYLFLLAPALVADFTGSAVSILDGDTIEVLHKQHAERIRLNGVDCSERRD
jgi:endonuclease YncB( thermonuclease family)